MFNKIKKHYNNKNKCFWTLEKLTANVTILLCITNILYRWFKLPKNMTTPIKEGIPVGQRVILTYCFSAWSRRLRKTISTFQIDKFVINAHFWLVKGWLKIEPHWHLAQHGQWVCRCCKKSYRKYSHLLAVFWITVQIMICRQICMLETACFL
jgi:hypothetical protein